MIRILGLHKSYGQQCVLQSISAEARERQCVAVVGPSGGGKSTLLRCINALESFDAGSIEVAGLTLTAGDSQDRSKLRELRRSVGMVFQELHLFSHLTALENVALAPHVVGGAARMDAEARARDLLARVGLANRAKAYPRELSGGQKQRVAIARALAMPVRVLLLDEPTSALDRERRDDVSELIRSLARERELTVVLVTHEAHFARQLADEVWLMRDGRIVAKGSPDVLDMGFESGS
jgi:ABC-type polar amino acid transport system ATPase subunit